MLRKLFLILLLLSFSKEVFAQQPDNAGIKKEMQSMLESMKKEIADLERQIVQARARKDMGEVAELQQELDMLKKNLALLQGGAKKMNEVSDNRLKELADEENRVVPRKDTTRIAAVPSKILTDQELRAYLIRVHLAVEKKIDPRMKKLAQRLYAAGQAKYPSVTAIANAANGYWMIGAPEIALWLMGKATSADPNADNLNNYAAFLTMAGAEQAALPILMNLNQHYPENSTILNNIGQAWFGLGDMNQARKYLSSAIRFFGTHSQANFTMCLVDESSGNIPAARDAILNSIRQSYSQEKEAQLRKLGGQLRYEDLKGHFHMPQDPLGLQKFTVPRFVKSTADGDVLGAEWGDIIRQWSAQRKELEAKMKALQPAVNRETEQRVAALESGGKGKGYSFGMLFSPNYAFAAKKLQLLMEDIDGHDAHIRKENDARMAQAAAEVKALRTKYGSEFGAITKAYEDRYGEGEDNPEEAE
jgi:Tfp pilus assembly protein PilF